MLFICAFCAAASPTHPSRVKSKAANRKPPKILPLFPMVSSKKNQAWLPMPGAKIMSAVSFPAAAFYQSALLHRYHDAPAKWYVGHVFPRPLGSRKDGRKNPYNNRFAAIITSFTPFRLPKNQLFFEKTPVPFLETGVDANTYDS